MSGIEINKDNGQCRLWTVSIKKGKVDETSKLIPSVVTKQ